MISLNRRLTMWAVLVGASLCGLPGRLSADPNGWAVGFGGTILHTSDGGATWSGQDSGTSNELLGVQFTDALTGWAVGAVGTILHTSDGGATWSGQDSGTLNGLLCVAVATPAPVPNAPA